MTKKSTSKCEHILASVDPEEKYDNERQIAEVILSPMIRSARTASNFTRPWLADTFEFDEVFGVMHDKVAKVQVGDLGELIAMLVAQAVALDAVFNEMAQRAQSADLLTLDAVMRPALSAQDQCRSTVKVIAEIQHGVVNK